MLGNHVSGSLLANGISLEKLVPAESFYYKLSQAVDFKFVRLLFAPYYSTTGRPSLDPVVFIKLLLVSHLENITSDRKLLQMAHLHLGIRYFIGYNLEQPLPFHSTLSRTRQRIPVTVFEQCFSKVLGLCIESGLVAGHTQAVDSAYVKANASITSMQPKQTIWIAVIADTGEGTKAEQKTHITASTGRLKHIHRLHAVIQEAQPKKIGQLLSNLTHYSPTDPDARIAVKTGKQRMLSYMASLGVDTAKHIITHIKADFSDWRDSRYLILIVDTITARLWTHGVKVDRVLADSGYGSGLNYQELEIRGIKGFIPPHGKYKPDRKGFIYSHQTDSYTCSQGKQLPFKKTFTDKEGNPKKRYMSKAADCKDCPIRKSCIPGTAREKRLHHTYYKAEYDRMLDRLSTKAGKQAMRKRSSTVEPVLGSLIEYYGLGKISVKRREGAAKVMYHLLRVCIGSGLRLLIT